MDRDPGLERLLDLDGFVAERGGGYWVKVDAVRVPPDPSDGRPGGPVLGESGSHARRRSGQAVPLP
jgi:hypothetical protein